MRYKRGFTLVEMMVTLAIFTVLLSAIYYVMATGQNTFFASRASVDVQQELRKFKESLTKDLLQGRWLTLTITTTITPADTINFQIPIAVANGGFVTWSNVTYAPVINPGLIRPQIVRAENPPPDPANPTKVVANNITTLNFARNGVIIQVTITAQKQDIRGRLITHTEIFDIKPRN